MSHENRVLYYRQQQMLDLLLERGANTREEHDKGIHYLTVKCASRT